VDLVFQGRADAVLTVASVAASEASAEVYANRWADTIRSDAPDLGWTIARRTRSSDR
jgi:hypothetical protein